MPYFWGLYAIFSVEIPEFQPTFMPYRPPLYGIFWVHFFANMGGGGGQNYFHSPKFHRIPEISGKQGRRGIHAISCNV